MEIEGRVIWKGDPDYEQARQAAVWNSLKPRRYPEVIVQAGSEADVAAAVRLAAQRGLKVKARAGGHSFTGSALRDGMLIDLSRLTDVAVDPAAKRARVQPAATGAALDEALAGAGLFFPSGHCPTVGLGGFLLAGGWGWRSRAIGPACLSIKAVDVVTAGGELIHADEEVNQDWLWAARGAGPGYPGVITAFELECHPRPSALYSRTDVYSTADADAVLRWAMEFEPTLPSDFEFAIMVTRPVLPDGRVVCDGIAVMIMATTLAFDDEEARTQIGRLEECPVLEQALHREEAVPVDFAGLFAGLDAVEPAGVRCVVDSLWTNASPDELVPRVVEIIDSLPTPESHVFWYPWRQHPLDGAALSVQADLFIAAYAGWLDPAEDERLSTWPGEEMRRLEPLSEGIQLSDENLIRRHGRFLSAESAARLEDLRTRHDPEGRFHGFLTAASDRPSGL